MLLLFGCIFPSLSFWLRVFYCSLTTVSSHLSALYFRDDILLFFILLHLDIIILHDDWTWTDLSFLGLQTDVLMYMYDVCIRLIKTFYIVHLCS
jgi:hypothetical protein